MSMKEGTALGMYGHPQRALPRTGPSDLPKPKFSLFSELHLPEKRGRNHQHRSFDLEKVNSPSFGLQY